MKREIKFRVWDKREKEMSHFDEVRILPGETMLYEIFEEDENIVFMQYTGLKDKNGKEIYEGDIIIKYFSAKSKTAPYIVEMPNLFLDYYDEETVLYNCEYEVIGNIYENPELLEESNEIANKRREEE